MTARPSPVGGREAGPGAGIRRPLMPAGACSPIQTCPRNAQWVAGRPGTSSCGTAGVSTCCARPPLRYGPPGDPPAAPRLGWQLWALRPGLDGASRPPTTLTGRGGPPSRGTPDRNCRSGLQPVSPRPAAPGGNRRANHRRRTTYAVSLGVSFRCRSSRRPPLKRAVFSCRKCAVFGCH